MEDHRNRELTLRFSLADGSWEPVSLPSLIIQQSSYDVTQENEYRSKAKRILTGIDRLDRIKLRNHNG